MYLIIILQVRIWNDPTETAPDDRRKELRNAIPLLGELILPHKPNKRKVNEVAYDRSLLRKNARARWLNIVGKLLVNCLVGR